MLIEVPTPQRPEVLYPDTERQRLVRSGLWWGRAHTALDFGGPYLLGVSACAEGVRSFWAFVGAIVCTVFSILTYGCKKRATSALCAHDEARDAARAVYAMFRYGGLTNIQNAPAPRLCWNVLGVTADASVAEVETAYRHLSQEHMAEITTAYHQAMKELARARKGVLS